MKIKVINGDDDCIRIKIESEQKWKQLFWVTKDAIRIKHLPLLIFLYTLVDRNTRLENQINNLYVEIVQKQKKEL